ncbi:hypothetical protein KZ829_35420 [Actinoplanes hulinensis]|uniref:Uncharacterized protein n=1 Tax=Actinoplanes hulinensis TaxID=1144547 RepID=A0ABS7BDA8_9ACTN|nr:hypothetical protein [Actinoplanes hulinensis]MBW6439033.1 hypothetical protein [Actinoplanes hulinensis]
MEPSRRAGQEIHAVEGDTGAPDRPFAAYGADPRQVQQRRKRFTDRPR